MKYLIFDITNVLYRTFYANKSSDADDLAGMAHHSALMTLNKYYKKFKPNKIIMCYDRSTWRKTYTASPEAITPKKYKGNRRKDMSPKQKEKFKQFIDHLSEFEDIMKRYTSAITLAGDKMEADDLVSGAVQVLSMEPENECIIISADKDMIQLLGFPNTRLVDPASGKDRTLDEWNGDANLFMFEKCIRGDGGDNVQSALPKVRKTKILEAYTDDFTRANMMNTTWTDKDKNEYVVKALFKENQLLMDLTKQPEDIQLSIVAIVLAGLNNPGEFSYFHFMKFLGKHEMKRISSTLDQFAPMLSS